MKRSLVQPTILVVMMILIATATPVVAADAGNTSLNEVPKFDLPVVVTPTGQTPGSLTLSMLFARIGVKVTHEPMLVPRQMQGYKTLIVVMGASLKGLGAAGINENEEMQRDNMVVDAARKAGMTVIAAHIGGQARRNVIADRFITPFVPRADFLLVLKESNEDGLFTKLAAENEIPILVVDDFPQLLSALTAMFK